MNGPLLTAALIQVLRSGDTYGVGWVRDDAGRPDGNLRPERHVPGEAEAQVARVRAEPRGRAEYAADMRQRAVLGEEREADLPLAAAAAARRFEPRHAGLPEVSAVDAAGYLEAHQAERPWLAAARDCSPEVQRIFAALDQGSGHGHSRHEGWITEEMNRRRVAYLEDPVQLDPVKRSLGIDGMRRPEVPHRCRDTSSRIKDPDAFAAAFVRGVEHPTVRASLAVEFTAGRVPRPISLPVSDLLGPDGHRYCTGWRLQPAGTFAGGTIVFVFGPTKARDGYEVVTMYPRPPRDEQQGDQR